MQTLNFKPHHDLLIVTIVPSAIITSDFPLRPPMALESVEVNVIPFVILPPFNSSTKPPFTYLRKMLSLSSHPRMRGGAHRVKVLVLERDRSTSDRGQGSPDALRQGTRGPMPPLNLCCLPQDLEPSPKV